ncbi:acyltransferase family protein [Oceanitalea stevensii]|uniref:Acyltransferase family protein n=1 Tax=Oceanitalea stevensii TaxID=2763072 RepID=A0ABR8Z073_9MICO|nr:acyltransferase family protein [Oceanitalea stevensii]MBD8061562.1 acyltransferase family protein [Oceanitalea stevensii]
MTTGSKPRESWVDVAKGGAIVLVVLYHAAFFLDDVGLAWFWSDAGGALTTFRMPLFFFTAGIFAAKALSLDLRHMFARRVLLLLWLYVLWSFIWTLAFQVLPNLNHEPTWSELALVLVWPHASTSTWFIYSLALYFLAAWSIRRLPVWAQLALATLVSLAFGAGVLDTGSMTLNKMTEYFVFFLAAALLGPRFRDLASRVRPRHAVMAAAGYLAVSVAVSAADAMSIPGIRLGVSCLAVVFGVTLAVVLSGRPTMRWLEFLGTRTLPIYVLHFYPIVVLAALLEPVADRLGWAAPLLPPVLTVGAILVSLGVHRVTRQVPGLYTLPPVRRRRPALSGTKPALSPAP